MFKLPFIGQCAAALVILSMSVPSANALTGEDIMSKMNADQRHAFIAGSIEMAALMFHLQGERQKASCVMDWFYDGDDGAQQILQAFAQFSDRQTHPVILTLINGACGQDN